MVDFVKPLQLLPTRTRTRGRAVYSGIMEVYGAMIERVRARMNNGDEVPDCLVKTLIRDQEKEKVYSYSSVLACVLYYLTAGLGRPLHVICSL
jgi:cytochrome P450